MTTPESVELRPLSVSDAPALIAFRCRRFRDPASELVEEMVHALPDELASGDAEALGMWTPDRELVGVAAWQIRQSGSGQVVCRCVVVAVRTGCIRRGYGRRLKEAVMEEARRAGASAVVSTVHWDNPAMIELNVSLGANVERVAGDWDYCRCIIPL